MNSSDIKKLIDRQKLETAELRSLVDNSQMIPLDKRVEARVLHDHKMLAISAFWLGEIALQFAIRNDLEVGYVPRKRGNSLWERIFGHKANDPGS